jgi:hypothetical protein
MSWFIASLLVLVGSTAVSVYTAMRLPRATRDVVVALVGAASVTTWIVFDSTHPGATLLGAGSGFPVTVADLAGLPSLAVAGLLVGRTMILSRQQAYAQALAEHQERQRRAAEVADIPVEEFEQTESAPSTVEDDGTERLDAGARA